MRQSKRFLRFSDYPVPSADGRHFSVGIETEDGETLNLEIPLSELGAIVSFLVLATAHINPNTTLQESPWEPIPTWGLKFAAGRSPAETLLVVHFQSFDLAFSIPTDELKRMEPDFVRILRVLSARTDVAH